MNNSTDTIHESSFENWDDHAELLLCAASLDSTNTRNSFEDYIHNRKSHYPETEYYANNGSWRETPALTDQELSKIESHNLTSEPNNCYYNAQTSVAKPFSYVEGYVIDRQTPVPHAWLELNGKVVDPTPTISRDTAHYFGVEFPTKELLDILIDTEMVNPVVEHVQNAEKD